MSYQESLIKVKKSEMFNFLAEYLSKHTKELMKLIDIVTVVTFKEDISINDEVVFQEGDKAVCITGQVMGQDKDFIFEKSFTLRQQTLLFPTNEFKEDDLNKMFRFHEAAEEISFVEYINNFEKEN